MTTQILLLLDVFASFAAESWGPASIATEHRLALTAHGLQRSEGDASLDWQALAACVEKLADRAEEIISSAPGDVEVFIGGQAPLSLFVHLGFRLSKFAGKQVFLGVSAIGGKIEEFDLSAAPTGAKVLTVEGKPPSAGPSFGTGLLPLYVDCAGRLPPNEAIVETLQTTGQGVLDLVAARAETATVITPALAPQVALELVQLLSDLPSRFPRRQGLALFVAGPTLLAFLVGRALNRTIVGKVLLTNYKNQVYETTYSLPFESMDGGSIDPSPEAEIRRHETRAKMTTAVDQLKRELLDEDVAREPLLDDSSVVALRAQLTGLLVASADTAEFKLSIARGELHFGRGLVEAISKLDDTKIADLTKLFVLHELVHDVQGIRTTNFAGVGRASVALEQVDYFADAFALRTLLRLEVRRGGPRAQESAAVRLCAVRLVDTILSGIEVFDQLEQGARIERLSERRLRRYLIWHLQRARATSIVGIENFDRMLTERIAVELAPLMGCIDLRRHDKIITRHTATASLFAAVDGKLVRMAPSRDLDPAAVLEAVRSYGRTPLETLMNVVLEENRGILAPWRR